VIKYIMRMSPSISLLTAIIAILILNGCGYVKMEVKKAHAERWKSLRARKAAYPESNFIVAGQLGTKQSRQVPLAIVASSDDLREDEIVDMFMVNAPSSYSLYLPPGTYNLLAFADLNGNRRFESSEVVGRFGDNGKLALSGKEGGVLTNVNIELDLENPSEADFRFYKPVRGGLSHVSLDSVTKSLEDPLFAERMGKLGLYDPANFMRRVPSMLYTVEGDISKVPVVFIHGIEGTPANWKYISGRLDRNRFHPWFFFYPSGENLEKSAEMLYWILEEKFPFEPVVLVAHSMGGLVGRAFIDMYSRERRSDYIAMFISLSTPYDGVPSAKAAVNNPVRAPSWIDIAPSSDFLNQYVQGGRMPEHMDFYLIFAYGDEGFALQCSDGTIALSSQLEPHTQSQARSVSGFSESHGGVLTSPEVSDRINHLLKSVAPAGHGEAFRTDEKPQHSLNKVHDKADLQIDMPVPHGGK
jgi:pimeloyl-ACP methyl ester carboxylesterase